MGHIANLWVSSFSLLDGDRNFVLNIYPYRKGMSGERSGKHNDNKAYQLN
ncbi:MAG: hypothetical protein ACJAYN_002803 [Bermanella sp.]|jgi:hypothetical protein